MEVSMDVPVEQLFGSYHLAIFYHLDIFDFLFFTSTYTGCQGLTGSTLVCR